MSKEQDMRDIESQLAIIRDNIARNVDLLVERTSPKRVIADLKMKAKQLLVKPVVFIPLVGIGALLASRFLKKLFRK